MRVLSWQTLLCCLAVVNLAGCSSDPDNGNDQSSKSTDEQLEKKSDLPTTPAFAMPKSSLCRVYSNEPGFQVFIDGEPVLTNEGEPLLTPCAVTVAHGDHEIRIAKSGFADAITIEPFPDTEEVELTAQSVESPDSILNAPLFDAETGIPIPLESLNSTGMELDPYLTADGLQIWFVGDRSEGRGIYVSTRASQYHHFDPPRFVEASRGRNLPASPSFTDDRLSLVYCIPEDARIWALSRPSPFADFTDKEPLVFSEELDVRWDSSQITADRSRIYWVENQDGQRTSKAAVWSTSSSKFGKHLSFALTGVHPCMTPDGLRQFSFDGSTLRRCWRPSLTASGFSEPEVVTSLELDNYVASEDRRQYCVSADEQWMIYCQNTNRESDLFIVRLSDRSNFGFAVTGKSIEDKAPEVVVNEPEDPEPKMPDKPVEPAPPVKLTYDDFRTQWLSALRDRNYLAARQLLKNHRGDFDGTAFSDAVEWDSMDLSAIEKLHADARQSLAALKLDDDVRIGGNKVKFVSFENETLTGERSGKQISRHYAELEAPDLIALADAANDRTDEAAQFRVGVFLFHDASGNPRSAKSRLQRSGELGKSFIDQQAGRLLALAESALENQQIGASRRQLREIQKTFASTEWSKKAQQLEEGLYSYVEWDMRGDRNWQSSSEGGEFVIAPGKSEGAMLISKRKYKTFQIEFEWKVVGRAGQGGVFFRYPGEGVPYDNALKLQLANDAGVVPDALCSGSIFKLESPNVNAALPEGQWNRLILQVDGPRIVATLNGQKIQDTDYESDSMPESGFVALDGELGGITYRKVLLMEWDGKSPPE